MSLTERIGAGWKALTATSYALSAFQKYGSGYFAWPRSEYIDGAYVEMHSASYAHIYCTQENVRIVVDAIARSAAKRSLKCYERNEDGTKVEDASFEAAETLRVPNDWQTQKEILNALIRDKLIYDDAFLWDMGGDAQGRRFLVRVPPHSIGVKSDNALRPSGYILKFQNGQTLPLTPMEIIHWRGYNPSNNRMGTSPLESLRTILVESAVRKAQSIDQIRGGNIKGGIVMRALDAPDWSPAARERFQESFAGRLRGTVKGEVALLEDGMAFQEAGITPREAEQLESRHFELAMVANVYGINPSLFSEQGNLAQAREMLDEDVVDPLLGDLADTLTTQLIRMIYGSDDHFFRFRPPKITDISKLFEAGSKATGGSTLTPNEFREDYLDKPPIDGGDDIVSHPGSQGGSTPPAPGSNPRGRPAQPAEDVGDQAEKEIQLALTKSREIRAKAEIDAKIDEHTRDKVKMEHVALLQKHFRRQKTAHTQGKLPILNQDRWDRELADDLRALARDVVKAKGDSVASTFNRPFDMVQVQNYLTAGADALAASINRQSESKVVKALGEGYSISQAYDSLISNVEHLAESRATQLLSFAALEAARQAS